MATKAAAKRKPEPAFETSQSLADQMAAFLKAGGEIQQIPNGVSGQTQRAVASDHHQQEVIGSSR